MKLLTNSKHPNMLRRLATATLLSVSLVSTHAAIAADEAEQILTFGVVPQQSASKLARTWGPILAYISEKAGVTIRFQTAPSIPEFEKRTAAGEYDLAYMNPYHYTEFSEAPGYVAFGKAKGKMIRGIMVVRKDSPIQSLEELRDQELAFPAPAAFAASVLPRAHFETIGIAITPKYVSSHDSVYLSVARGLVPAGGGVKRTLATVDASVRDQLRVLWTTDPYTSHALAAHPRLSDEQREAIQAAFIAMESDEQGQALLKKLAWKGVEPADDARWDDVRDLGLTLLNRLIKGS